MFDDVIDGIVEREGGYSNDPNDRGGETMYGITKEVARKYGYNGPMRDLPRPLACEIYRNVYVVEPGFDRVAVLSPIIAEELIDTGVNMGVGTASKFLQRALNGLNREQRDYPDMREDGHIGPATLAALEAYLDVRGPGGDAVMSKALNCMQGARYFEIVEGRPQNESFIFGWLRARVNI